MSDDQIICAGCKHHIPIMADCRLRYWGEDGWLHFPEGDCWTAPNAKEDDDDEEA